MHQREQVVAERLVLLPDAGQAQLPAHPMGSILAVPIGKRLEHLGRRRNGRLRLRAEQGQQGLGQPREVPQRDAGLVAVRVAAAVIDRAEHRGGVVGVHERARAVVDALAGDRHVVGVHDAVDEPGEHPVSDERRLRVDDALQEREIRILGVGRMRVVARDRVVGEALDQRGVPARRVLERADADVAGRHARQHRAGQHRLPRDEIAGRHHGERPAGGDAERVHRLADHVLAEHRPDRRLAVAPPRERRAARALQVQVATASGYVEDLTQKEGAAVSEARGVAAELMAGVGLRHRRGALRQDLADESGHPVGRPQSVGLDTQLPCEVLVEHQQPRRRPPCRLPWLVQALEVARVGVVEREERPSGNTHAIQANAAGDALASS